MAMAGQNKGIILPENVTHATFSLAEKITTDDVSIQNPLGSVNYQYILAINFSVTSGTAGFFANPLSNRDSTGNRMLTVDSTGIRGTEFYPWVSFTADAITLRGSRNGGYNPGLYHVFAWGKIDN